MKSRYFAYLALASLIFVGSSSFAQDKIKPVEKKVEKKVEKTVAVKDTTAKKVKRVKKAAVKKAAEKKAAEKKVEAAK